MNPTLSAELEKTPRHVYVCAAVTEPRVRSPIPLVMVRGIASPGRPQ